MVKLKKEAKHATRHLTPEELWEAALRKPQPNPQKLERLRNLQMGLHADGTPIRRTPSKVIFDVLKEKKRWR